MTRTTFPVPRAAAIAAALLTTLLQAQTPTQSPVQPLAPTAPMPTVAMPGIVVADQSFQTFGYTPFGWRIGVRHQSGDGVGYQNGYSVVEGFAPFGQGTSSLNFADLRGIMANDGRIYGNVGIGRRMYVEDYDRIFGVNVYYDNRNTGRFTFSQVGVGLETLGNNWDFRLNGFLPFDEERKLLGEAFTDPFYRGYNIILNRFQAFEAALRGFDAELGVPLLSRWDVRGYVGMYYLNQINSPTTTGVRARLAALLTDSLAMNLVVTNDRLFDTTVTAGVSFTFPGLRFGDRPGRREVIDRLADPVGRNDNVVVHQQNLSSQVVALETTSPREITVVHVDNTTAAGGDGSFERPFNLLLLAEALNDPNAIPPPGFSGQPPNIIFVRQGDGTSTGQDQGIRLAQNQRLLGQGCTHLVASNQGVFQLPGTIPGAFPTITNTVIEPLRNGNAVVLAENSEVSGFNIVGARASGVTAGNILNFRVICNNILNNAEAGVAILDAPARIGALDSGLGGFAAPLTQGFAASSQGRSGANPTLVAVNTNPVPIVGGEVLQNTIAGNPGAGVFVGRTIAVKQTVLIRGNNIDANGRLDAFGEGQGSGVDVQTGASGLLTLTVDGNQINNNFRRAINVLSNGLLDPAILDNSTLRLAVTGNVMDRNGGDGIGVFANNVRAGAATVIATVVGNRITNTGGVAFGGRGMNIFAFDNATVNADITGNVVDTTIFAAGLSTVGFGINVGASTGGSARFTGTVVGNEVRNTFDDGLRVVVRANSRVRVLVANNLVENTDGSGIELESTQSGQLTVDLVQNRVINANRAQFLFDNGINFSARNTSNSLVNIIENRVDGVLGAFIVGDSDTGNGIYLSAENDSLLTTNVIGNTVVNADNAAIVIGANLFTVGNAQHVAAVRTNTVTGNNLNPTQFFLLAAPRDIAAISFDGAFTPRVCIEVTGNILGAGGIGLVQTGGGAILELVSPPVDPITETVGVITPVPVCTPLPPPLLP